MDRKQIKSKRKKSKVEELKNLITELGRIEKNVVYKIGLIDGMKEKKISVFNYSY